MKQEFAELHEELGLNGTKNSKTAAKADFYRDVEALLKTHWTASLETLRNDSPDGLGLLVGSKSDELFRAELAEERTWLTAEKLEAAVDSAQSRTETVNAFPVLMNESVRLVTQQTLEECRKTAPSLFASLHQTAPRRRGVLSQMPEFDLGLLLSQGFGTARKTTWSLFDVSHALFAEKYDRPPSHDEWHALCKRTLPVLGVLAKTHLQVMHHVNLILRGMTPKQKIPNPQVPLMKSEYFELHGSEQEPEIRFSPELFEEVREKMIEEGKSILWPAVIGCPGSHIIAPLHKWCVSIADAYLLERSEEFSETRRVAPSSSVIEVPQAPITVL